MKPYAQPYGADLNVFPNVFSERRQRLQDDLNCALRGSCDFLGSGGRTNNAGLTKAFGAGFPARLPWKLLSLQRISSGSVSSPPVPG